MGFNLPAIWGDLEARGMTAAELRTLSEDAVIARLLALEDELQARSDDPFRDPITPDIAAVIARRLKATAHGE